MSKKRKGRRNRSAPRPGPRRQPPPREALPSPLEADLGRALRSAWARGWQPNDLRHAAGRRLSPAAIDVVVAAILGDAKSYTGPGVWVDPEWARQLDGLDAARPASDDLEAPLHALGFLMSLPALPLLMPPPGKWKASPSSRAASASRADPKLLARIRALLAQAESTTFPAEAETFTLKAQEIMARYSIDAALLASVDTSADGASARRIGIEDPYTRSKCVLLSQVADANRCRTVSDDRFGFCTVFGFASDLANVELLYTSLLVQADVTMTRAGPQRDSMGRSRTRSFRSSFLTSFAFRIGERLREVTTSVVEEASRGHHGLLPVLSDRVTAVEAAVGVAYPHTVARSIAISNRDGWVAGRVAADLADLTSHRSLV